MPIQCKIDHDKRFIHVEATGPVTMADILSYFDKFVVENAMPYPKLFDATQTKADLTDEDIMTMGARVSAYALHDPRGPLALVAKDEHIVNFLRRFMNLGLARRPAMLFRRVEDAQRWLDQIAIEDGLNPPPRPSGATRGAGA